jgi:hypothetical protein
MVRAAGQLLGLAKSLRAAVHHSSPIYVKRNILTSTFIPHPLLSRQDFSRLVLDYLVFANGYLEKRMSVTGQLEAGNLTGQIHPPWCRGWRLLVRVGLVYPHQFAPGSVFHCLSLISIRSSTGCRNT